MTKTCLVQNKIKYNFNFCINIGPLPTSQQPQAQKAFSVKLTTGNVHLSSQYFNVARRHMAKILTWSKWKAYDDLFMS